LSFQRLFLSAFQIADIQAASDIPRKNTTLWEAGTPVHSSEHSSTQQRTLLAIRAAQTILRLKGARASKHADDVCSGILRVMRPEAISATAMV
jgi:hypothetical protein